MFKFKNVQIQKMFKFLKKFNFKNVQFLKKVLEKFGMQNQPKTK
jgi:sulfur relay (sulfurtransferase) DsrF/TusC family protein